MAFDGREAVGVTAAADVLLAGSCGLLAEDVAPNLIDLHIIDRHALDLFGHERLAALADQLQDFQDGRFAGVSDAANRTHRDTLAEHFDDLGGAVQADTEPAEGFRRFGPVFPQSLQRNRWAPEAVLPFVRRFSC